MIHSLLDVEQPPLLNAGIKPQLAYAVLFPVVSCTDRHANFRLLIDVTLLRVEPLLLITSMIVSGFSKVHTRATLARLSRYTTQSLLIAKRSIVFFTPKLSAFR